MANRIKIRHGSGTPNKDQLLPYELGWNGTSLYINNGGTVEKVGKEYLPLTGGTVTGDITMQGGTSTNSIRINLNRYDGSVTGFVGYSRDSSKYGLYITGTGAVNGYLALMDTTNGRVYYRDSYSNNSVALSYSQSGLTTTSWFAAWNNYELRAISPQNSANTGLDALSAGTSDPVDGDTYIASYADGKNVAHNGTNTYHRRPVASLYNYIKGKASGSWAISITGNASTATSATSATNSTKALALYTGTGAYTSGSSTDGDRAISAMQAFWNANKTTVARNQTISVYLNTGNGLQATGYFLSGYDSTPYGGFFLSHYAIPRYLGISNGNWYCNALIRDSGDVGRRIFLTTSASVPSGAAVGDIVLVKV